MERARHTRDIGDPTANCIARWEDDGGRVINVSGRRAAVPTQRTRLAIVERTVPRSVSPQWTVATRGHQQAGW